MYCSYKKATIWEIREGIKRQILMWQHRRIQAKLQSLRDIISQDHSQLQLEGIEMRTVASLRIKGKDRVVLRYWSKRKDAEKFLLQRYNDLRLIVEYTNPVPIAPVGRVSLGSVIRKV